MTRSLLLLILLLAPVTSASAQSDAAANDPAPTPPGTRVVLRGVQFAFDTAYIEPVSRGTLEAVVKGILDRPGVRVRIEGHTDATGTEEYNQQLSQERADSVKRILVGFGVPAEQLEAVGYGEKRPLAPNDTAEGRALNRRVELVVE